MRNLAHENPKTSRALGTLAARGSIIVLAVTGILGACAIAGSFFLQWQRIEADSESLDALLAEQVARATLEELGVLVSPDPQTKHVHSLNFFACKELDHRTLQKLGALPHVVVLNLNDCTITDEQLRYVCGLPKLICLSLKGTRVSDNGLAELADSLDLVALHLSNPSISDEGLRHVARMRRLKILDLRNTLATEQGLRHMRNMDRLEVLMLTEITDAGVPHLMQIRSLKQLCVNRNKLSEARLKQLEKAMPKLTIDCFAAN